MRVEIKTENLKKAVGLTEKIASRHATLPALSCILLEVGKNEVVFKSTNLDVGIQVEIPAKSNSTGTVAVPAHTISSLLSQSPDKDHIAVIESSGENITITLQKTKSTIKTIPHDDFPGLPEIQDGKKTSIPAEALVKGLKSVWYSAAVSNVKPELSSIYLYKEGDAVVFAATDSFRLAEKKVLLPKQTTFEDVLIPFKNCVEISRALESISGEVAMSTTKNLVLFESQGIKIVSRVVDGVFPDYHQIIPKSHVTEAIALKQDVVGAMKLSSVFSDSFNQVKMTVDPGKKAFDIQTKNNDVGEAKTSLDAALSGEAIEVNFNGKYVTDCFQSIDADSISMQWNGKNKPMVIRPVSGDQSFLYLVMPMNR